MIRALLLSVLTIFLLPQSVVADTFDGYECTDDCSGHQAGYDWAEEHGIDDDSSCSTASNSFNEGCESYVNGGAGSIAVDDDEDDEEDEEY